MVIAGKLIVTNPLSKLLIIVTPPMVVIMTAVVPFSSIFVLEGVALVFEGIASIFGCIGTMSLSCASCALRLGLSTSSTVVIADITIAI